MNAGRIRATIGSAATKGSLSVNAGSIDLCVPPEAGLRLDVEDQLTFADEPGLARAERVTATPGPGPRAGAPERSSSRSTGTPRLQPRPHGRLLMGTRLYRSRDDRMIAGVAGGLGQFLPA